MGSGRTHGGVSTGTEVDICLKGGREDPNEIITLWNILLGGFPTLKNSDNAMSGCQLRHRYVMFSDSRVNRAVRGRCQTAAGPTKQIPRLSNGTRHALFAAESARM